MDRNLKGRVVAVTGAFGNLGLAVAQAAAEQGAKVVMLGHSPSADVPHALEHALQITGIDLTSWDDAQAAMTRVAKECGHLDALVNVAGGFRWQTLADGDLEAWDQMYNVNLRTAVTASKAALPLLLQSRAGRIVNIGSSGAQKAGAGMGAYAASKAGVARLTESLAEELKERGVTVNAVLPRTIDTPQNRADMPNADFSRWVTPEQLAAVITFLLSDAASAVTGALIPVNGRV